jgi:hypothetical protein
VARAAAGRAASTRHLLQSTHEQKVKKQELRKKRVNATTWRFCQGCQSQDTAQMDETPQR